jgi:ABC-2 type transport system ATP-binding protein
MLATLLVPPRRRGVVAWCLRRDPRRRRRLGYVSQTGGTNPSAKVDEEPTGRVTSPAAGARARGAARRSRSTELGDRLIKTLSGGQKRRLDIALGLVHRPRLVFLDEPSTGLDPHSRANLWTHIRSLRDRDGATILLTTHYLDEADALCDRILIIDTARSSPPARPVEPSRQISATSSRSRSRRARATEVLRARGGRATSPVRRGLRVTVAHGGESPPLMRALDGRASGQLLHIAHPSLDDVFLTLTGRSLRDDAPATPPAARS